MVASRIALPLSLLRLGHYIFIITLPLYIKHLQGVWTRSERALDPMLPMLVISTFFLSILAGAGFLIF